MDAQFLVCFLFVVTDPALMIVAVLIANQYYSGAIRSLVNKLVLIQLNLSLAILVLEYLQSCLKMDQEGKGQ